MQMLQWKKVSNQFALNVNQFRNIRATERKVFTKLNNSGLYIRASTRDIRNDIIIT